jgi:hypothetical protein
MNKALAMMFALLGISALSAISIAISFRNEYAALLSLVIFFIIMFIGFFIKAKMKKKQSNQ